MKNTNVIKLYTPLHTSNEPNQGGIASKAIEIGIFPLKGDLPVHIQSKKAVFFLLPAFRLPIIIYSDR